ncbi:Rho GTPase-activating protein 9, partial [Gonapodya sp. JEL0774]
MLPVDTPARPPVAKPSAFVIDPKFVKKASVPGIFIEKQSSGPVVTPPRTASSNPPSAKDTASTSSTPQSFDDSYPPRFSSLKGSPHGGPPDPRAAANSLNMNEILGLFTPVGGAGPAASAGGMGAGGGWGGDSGGGGGKAWPPPRDPDAYPFPNLASALSQAPTSSSSYSSFSSSTTAVGSSVSHARTPGATSGGTTIGSLPRSDRSGSVAGSLPRSERSAQSVTLGYADRDVSSRELSSRDTSYSNTTTSRNPLDRSNLAALERGTAVAAGPGQGPGQQGSISRTRSSPDIDGNSGSAWERVESAAPGGGSIGSGRTYGFSEYAGNGSSSSASANPGGYSNSGGMGYSSATSGSAGGAGGYSGDSYFPSASGPAPTSTRSGHLGTARSDRSERSDPQVGGSLRLSEREMTRSSSGPIGLGHSRTPSSGKAAFPIPTSTTTTSGTIGKSYSSPSNIQPPVSKSPLVAPQRIHRRNESLSNLDTAPGAASSTLAIHPPLARGSPTVAPAELPPQTPAVTPSAQQPSLNTLMKIFDRGTARSAESGGAPLPTTSTRPQRSRGNPGSISTDAFTRSTAPGSASAPASAYPPASPTEGGPPRVDLDLSDTDLSKSFGGMGRRGSAESMRDDGQDVERQVVKKAASSAGLRQQQSRVGGRRRGATEDGAMSGGEDDGQAGTSSRMRAQSGSDGGARWASAGGSSWEEASYRGPAGGPNGGWTYDDSWGGSAAYSEQQGGRYSASQQVTRGASPPPIDPSNGGGLVNREPSDDWWGGSRMGTIPRNAGTTRSQRSTETSGTAETLLSSASSHTVTRTPTASSMMSAGSSGTARRRVTGGAGKIPQRPRGVDVSRLPDIPYVLRECVGLIEEIGMDQAGLYRIAGSVGTANMLRSLFEELGEGVKLRPPPKGHNDERGHAASGNGVSIMDRLRRGGRPKTAPAPTSAARAVAVATAMQSGTMPSDPEEYARMLYDADIHVVAGVVKRVVTEGLPLPGRGPKEPVTTFALYEKFLELAEERDYRQKMIGLQDLVHSLPPLNFAVLRFICEHLKRVSEMSSRNLMSASNLAIVFGPGLLQSRTDSQVGTRSGSNTPRGMPQGFEFASMIRDTPRKGAVVESLIEYAEWVFGPIEFEEDEDGASLMDMEDPTMTMANFAAQIVPVPTASGTSGRGQRSQSRPRSHSRSRRSDRSTSASEGGWVVDGESSGRGSVDQEYVEEVPRVREIREGLSESFGGSPRRGGDSEEEFEVDADLDLVEVGSGKASSRDSPARSSGRSGARSRVTDRDRDNANPPPMRPVGSAYPPAPRIRPIAQRSYSGNITTGDTDSPHGVADSLQRLSATLESGIDSSSQPPSGPRPRQLSASKQRPKSLAAEDEANAVSPRGSLVLDESADAIRRPASAASMNSSMSKRPRSMVEVGGWRGSGV